jgi:uncharacterized RDD family membrane protein YckC
MDQSQSANVNESSTVNTNPPVAVVNESKTSTNVSYAGFWIRAAALILDSLIVGVVTFFIGFILGVVGGASKGALPATLVENLASLIGIVVSFSYYVLMVWKKGATLGKQAVGLRVLRGNGENMSLGRAALREIVGKFASGIILGIGYIMAAFSDKKRALHDMIADTVVVDLHPEKKKTGWIVFAVIFTIAIPVMTIAFVVFIFSLIGGPNAFLDAKTSSYLRVSAKDMEVAGYLEETMSNARFYRLGSKEENFVGTFKGFSPDDNLDQDGNILVNAECSGDPYVYISDDGKEIAAFAKSCDDPKKYLCFDEGIEMNIDDDGDYVDEEVAKSGVTHCPANKGSEF